MSVTEAEIEAAMTPNGGWTKEQLAQWGVPWPPPKGWKSALLSTEAHSQAVEREAAVPGGLYVICSDCKAECVRDVGDGPFAEFAHCETCGGIGFVPLATPAHRPPQPGVVTEELRVPEGWKLVPVEPTEEMVEQGSFRAIEFNACYSIQDIYDLFRKQWARVLAAAPSPGASVTASPAAETAPDAGLVFQATHRHLQSDGLYQMLGTAIDATNGRETDETVVIYRNAKGDTFVRVRSQFEDGRFAALSRAGER